MLRISICAVILFACATSSKTVTRDVHDCVYLGLIDGGSRSEIVSEIQTMGPSHVIWLHPPEVVRGYLVESNRSLYSCPSPPALTVAARSKTALEPPDEVAIRCRQRGVKSSCVLAASCCSW